MLSLPSRSPNLKMYPRRVWKIKFFYVDQVIFLCEKYCLAKLCFSFSPSFIFHLIIEVWSIVWYVFRVKHTFSFTRANQTTACFIAFQLCETIYQFWHLHINAHKVSCETKSKLLWYNQLTICWTVLFLCWNLKLHIISFKRNNILWRIHVIQLRS